MKGVLKYMPFTVFSPDSADVMADTSERLWLGAQGPREEALVFAVGFMIALFTCALIMPLWSLWAPANTDSGPAPEQ